MASRAFPEWNAWHRLCLVCLDYVTVEEEMGEPWFMTRNHYTKWSLHPGECLAHYKSIGVKERNILANALYLHRSANTRVLEQDAKADGTYDYFKAGYFETYHHYTFPYLGAML